MKNLLLQNVILLSILAACSTIPSDVRMALEQAGINRPELEKVIAHYKATGERQKLKAAYFLIANMPGKYAEYYSCNEQAYEMFLRGKDANKRNNRVAYEDSIIVLRLHVLPLWMTGQLIMAPVNLGRY